MMRQFSRRFLTAACVLVLALTVFAAAATAGVVGDSSPKLQMTNTGEMRTHVFQGHVLTPPSTRGAGGSILYAPSESDNSSFRADVAACTGGTVDYFDAISATPDVALLSTYDVVFVWGNYAFADAVGYGSASALSRAFAARIGASPTEWLRRHAP